MELEGWLPARPPARERRRAVPTCQPFPYVKIRRERGGEYCRDDREKVGRLAISVIYEKCPAAGAGAAAKSPASLIYSSFELLFAANFALKLGR